MAYTTIDDPSAYFQTKLYTGNLGDNRAITNDGNSDLQPDWIWFKNRDTTNSHNVLDSTRGIGKKLEGPDNTNAEGDTSTRLTSFDSNGFTVRTDPSVNGNGNGIVAWQWKANGGTTVSNTDGTITSTVQANTTAGFSIVTYTGNGSGGATIGHGLGAVPKMVICKNRDTAGTSWQIYHAEAQSSGADQLKFTSDAVASNTAVWNDTEPSSSVFTVGTGDGVNKSGDNLIAYCFSEVQGYSSIKSYTGNGSSSSGSFVYLGFKPRWLMIKRTNASQSWHVSDTKMKTFNPNTQRLLPNLNIAEETRPTTDSIDFLSNGFKCYSNENIINGNGDTYIYMAFAEHPFVSSDGVPTTAR